MLFKKLLILFFFLLVFGLEIIHISSNVSPILYQLIFNINTIELRKSNSQTVNLLILGIGGGKHEGPNLSDTIIFTSLNIKEGKVNLVSLPRDIWSFEMRGKINSAYAKGEDKKKGGGLTLAKSVISKIVGQNINYVVVIDFSGFIKAVDLMGGLDIYVEKTFDDYQYPLAGKESDPCEHTEEEINTFTASTSAESDLAEYFPCRYEHLHFDKGPTHMDGETALKFVRSRHAKGSEGTDFARSQRQEKAIKAFMDKAFSLQILVNPAKVIGLYAALSGSVNTDVKQNELDDFVKLAQKFQHAKIQSVVVDYGDNNEKRGGLLTHPPISKKYNYEWVLVPRIGENDYSEIHEYINCKLIRDDCSVSEIP